MFYQCRALIWDGNGFLRWTAKYITLIAMSEAWPRAILRGWCNIILTLIHYKASKRVVHLEKVILAFTMSEVEFTIEIYNRVRQAVTVRK